MTAGTFSRKFMFEVSQTVCKEEKNKNNKDREKREANINKTSKNVPLNERET